MIWEKHKNVMKNSNNLKRIYEHFEKEQRKDPSAKFVSFVSYSTMIESARKNILKEAYIVPVLEET